MQSQRCHNWQKILVRWGLMGIGIYNDHATATQQAFFFCLCDIILIVFVRGFQVKWVLSCVIVPFGRQGPAATLRQRRSQMTWRCWSITKHFTIVVNWSPWALSMSTLEDLPSLLLSTVFYCHDSVVCVSFLLFHRFVGMIQENVIWKSDQNLFIEIATEYLSQ